MDVIDHVSISVANINESVRWYTTSFNCELLHESATEATLQFQNVKLVLSLPSQQPRHLAFLKTDAETYGQLRRQSDGSRSTMVSDPAGNVVELIAPKTTANI